MAARQYLVSIAMAVLAIGGDFSSGDDLRMRAVRVRIFCASVTARAKHFLRRSLVPQALHIVVAVNAGKLHRAVDRMLQFLPIDKQRDLLAIHVFGQRVVTVTGEAVLVFQLVLGTSGEGRAQQKDHERTEQYSAGNFHD